MMFDSGSRGSRDQIRQLAGMRGLMAKPQKKLTGGIGEIIESPIKSNFREGLTVLEYFISTHGARKGLADTALKTADAGYLTRRLVDVAQDVTITEEDCGTILGLEIAALKEGEDIIEPLRERIVGSVAAEDVVRSARARRVDGDRTLLVEAGQLIDEEIAQRDRGRRASRRSRSARCSPARRSAASAGCATAATWPPWTWWTWARRSASWRRSRIGEPGTQLTLRTFHIGGTSSRIAEEAERRARSDGKVKYTDGLEWADVPVEFEDGTKGTSGSCSPARTSRRRTRARKASWWWIRRTRSGSSTATRCRRARSCMVKEGDLVTKGDNERRATILYTWDPYNDPSIIKADGELRWKDLVPGVTLREELDEGTGLRSASSSWPTRTASSIRRCWCTCRTGRTRRSTPWPRAAASSWARPTDQVSRAMEIPGRRQPVEHQVPRGRAADQRGVAEQDQEGDARTRRSSSARRSR